MCSYLTPKHRPKHRHCWWVRIWTNWSTTWANWKTSLAALQTNWDGLSLFFCRRFLMRVVKLWDLLCVPMCSHHFHSFPSQDRENVDDSKVTGLEWVAQAPFFFVGARMPAMSSLAPWRLPRQQQGRSEPYPSHRPGLRAWHGGHPVFSVFAD